MTTRIKIANHGPLIVDGDFELVDAEGNQVEIKKKALCRCGNSAIKPFCDGSHSRVGFDGAIASMGDAAK